MTGIFAAVTNRQLEFFDVTGAGQSLDVAPKSRVTVTLDPNGENLMTTYVEGRAYSCFGSDYTRIIGPLHPDEVGGIGPGTEYGDKVAGLAFNLAKMAYPYMKSWADEEPEIEENYLADADGIIRAYPHLLSLPERERLAPLFAEVAI